MMLPPQTNSNSALITLQTDSSRSRVITPSRRRRNKDVSFFTGAPFGGSTSRSSPRFKRGFFTIQPQKMIKQQEYMNQQNISRRLAQTKIASNCTKMNARLDQQRQSATNQMNLCDKINLTGREGTKVLEHIEVATGITNQQLVRDINSTFIDGRK